MKAWRITWEKSRPGHDVEQGCHSVMAETLDEAIGLAYQHLASIGIGDGERLTSGVSVSVLPVGPGAECEMGLTAVSCHAWLALLAALNLRMGLLMAVGVGIVIVAMRVFIDRDGIGQIDEATSDWLRTRGDRTTDEEGGYE
jgi:hypothetical protein